MSVIYDPEVTEVEDDPTWYWRISQPVEVDGTATGDVDLELAPLFYDWEDDDLQRLLHVIARKLQYTASLLLSAPARKESDQ